MNSRPRRSPYAVAIVLAIVVFILGFPEVNEGNAMSPTIDNGQVLVVHKVKHSEKRGAPDEGQVVVLEKPYSQEMGADDNIISRVVGLPGDTIKISNGVVYRNGEEYITASGVEGCRKNVNINVKLKSNEVFLLNDNRDQKGFDSTLKKMGPVDMSQIKGDALLSVWPINHFGGLKK